MRKRPTKRYCADPQAIAAMKRDGLGWGHDVECGSFELPVSPRRKSAEQTLIKRMRGV